MKIKWIFISIYQLRFLKYKCKKFWLVKKAVQQGTLKNRKKSKYITKLGDHIFQRVFNNISYS